jgi:TolB-like protein
MSHNGIPADVIQAELEKILASHAFAKAGRASRFLRFVVAWHLQGRSAEIKEYVVGVEVLGKKPDFDPRTDTIVRAEAKRLRERLDQYYASEGKHDKVKISVLKGSYAPQIEYINPAPDNTETAQASPEQTGRWPRKAWLAAVAALALAAVLLGPHVPGWRGLIGGRTPAIDSLAVLPLENLSRDADQEYFADGMTDELITSLGKIRALRVISRTSAMRYKGMRKTVAEIARELNVNAVVEGTVLRVGNRIRITAQLIQVKPEKHLWAETYERDVRDILALQESVAHDIAGEIRIKLTQQERAGILKSRPINPEAHEAYLKGIYSWNQRTRPALERSIHYFNQAIQKDENYALAYAGLANAYNLLGIYANVAPRDCYPKARAAAVKALAFDDTLAEGHMALGVYYSVYEWNQPAADREFRLAIALNPGNVLAHTWHGETLSAMQRNAEAVAELDRALELDPASLNVSDQRGFVLYMARRYDEAIEQLHKTISLEPRSPHARCWLGKAYLQKRKIQEGLTELQEAAGLPGGDSPVYKPWLGYAYALSGKRDEASAVLKAIKGQAAGEPDGAFGLAVIYCGLGQKDQSLFWLERACDQRDPSLIDIVNEPAFDSLRSDARFQELVRRSSLPP